MADSILDIAFEEWFTQNEHYRNLPGPRRSLSDKYGKGGWGEDEFVQWMHDLYDQKVEKARIEKVKRPPIAPQSVTGDVEERVKYYLSYYENPAPNDIVLIRQLSRIEASLDEIASNQMEAIRAGNRAEAKTWSDMLKSLTGEHRLVQERLGIDRAKRESKDKSDQEAYVSDLIRRTATFVDEHTVPIRCPYCKDTPAETEINMGFILFHFRQDVPWNFKFQCPMCEQEVVICP